MSWVRAAPTVHRLMAVSRARLPGSVVEQLLALRQEISRFNAKRGLNTAIFYSAGWILQWLEGPEASVQEAWMASQAHPAHEHHRMIHRSVGPATLDQRLHIASLHSS
jgi:hypothetical protein